MPRIRRWHPVSHDFVRDREVQELRKTTKDWMGYVWLEMLSEADKNEGCIKGTAQELATSYAWVALSQRPEWARAAILQAIDWMVSRRWLEQCNGYFYVRNYAEYHKTRGIMKSHAGIKKVPSEPNEPSEPTKTTQELEVTAIPRGRVSSEESHQSLRRGKPGGRAQPATAGMEAWEHYCGAYRTRYGVAPIRNARVNSMLARLSTVLPQEELGGIIEHYCRHQGALYVRAKHPVNLLLRDAEALRTEWATGRMVTDTEAREADRRTGLGARYRAVAEKFRKEEAEEAKHEEKRSE